MSSKPEREADFKRTRLLEIWSPRAVDFKEFFPKKGGIRLQDLMRRGIFEDEN